jgi:hypothetical protein
MDARGNWSFLFWFWRFILFFIIIPKTPFFLTTLNRVLVSTVKIVITILIGIIYTNPDTGLMWGCNYGPKYPYTKNLIFSKYDASQGNSLPAPETWAAFSASLALQPFAI